MHSPQRTANQKRKHRSTSKSYIAGSPANKRRKIQSPKRKARPQLKYSVEHESKKRKVRSFVSGSPVNKRRKTDQSPDHWMHVQSKPRPLRQLIDD
jgi:carbonic anhydrase/acetyltransferase-like protein (isoleucine patch superfamily)